MRDSPKRFVGKAISIAGGLALSALIGGAALATGSAWAGNTSYQYDALGRVVKVTYPDAKQVCYFYDAAGNRYLVQHKATGTCTPTAITLTTTSSLVTSTSSDQMVVSQETPTDAVASDAETQEAVATSSEESAATN